MRNLGDDRPVNLDVVQLAERVLNLLESAGEAPPLPAAFAVVVEQAGEEFARIAQLLDGDAQLVERRRASRLSIFSSCLTAFLVRRARASAANSAAGRSRATICPLSRWRFHPPSASHNAVRRPIARYRSLPIAAFA
jgi:hypothetical protein